MSAVSAGPPVGPGRDLVDCCQWVVEAETAQDAQHLAAALGALYEHLSRSGWTAPRPAELLVQLRQACFEAAAKELLTPRQIE